MVQECAVYTKGYWKGEPYCADVCHPNPCGRKEVCELKRKRCHEEPCAPMEATCTRKKDSGKDRCDGKCGDSQVRHIVLPQSIAFSLSSYAESWLVQRVKRQPTTAKQNQPRTALELWMCCPLLLGLNNCSRVVTWDPLCFISRVGINSRCCYPRVRKKMKIPAREEHNT